MNKDEPTDDKGIKDFKLETAAIPLAMEVHITGKVTNALTGKPMPFIEITFIEQGNTRLTIDPAE